MTHSNKTAAWKTSAITLALTMALILSMMGLAGIASANDGDTVVIDTASGALCVDWETDEYWAEGTAGFDECVAKANAEEVPEQTTPPAPAPTPAPVTASPPSGKDGGCSNYKAEGWTESYVKAEINGKTVYESKPNRQSYAIEEEVCVQLTGDTGADASATASHQ